MKVCDLTQSYAEAGGGVRTHIHAQRDFIRDHTGHQHLLIVPGAEDSVAREGRCTTYTVASPPVPGSTQYRLLLRSDRVLRILRAERPDVINAYCAYNLPWTAFHFRREHRCPVVGVYMTDVPTAYVEPTVGRLGGARAGRGARALTERYVRALYGRCDATLAISPTLATRLREMGVPKVEYVPLGVDLETFHPARRDPALRARLGVGEDQVLGVYAGRLDGEKRAGVVVDAFERLDPARFALVLAGEGPLRPELEARAAANLRVLPFQRDRGALATLLASADVYVSAMPFETFGLSVVEAQACGLPVVGVRSGAMVDRVPDGVGLLGAVDDPDEMARNVASLDIGKRREMGSRARALVEAEFSWTRTFRRIFEIYGELGAS